MYWSAAFWTMGSTVVEPLILMVCLWPDATGVAVAAGAAAVMAGVPAASLIAGEVTGTCVATGALVDGVVQPAASASMNTATRLKAMIENLLIFPLMVFYHPYYWRIYTDFRHKL
jgi:hypothetical protein